MTQKVTQDARFEDASERPLNLGALEPDEIQIISSLIQDAVVTTADIAWRKRERQLVLLLNRYRWEHERHANVTPERVRTMLVIDNVMTVSSMGLDPSARDVILSVLELSYTPDKDGLGDLTLILAGDGAIRARTEALEVRLKDVTRPYRAPSGKKPQHDL